MILLCNKILHARDTVTCDLLYRFCVTCNVIDSEGNKVAASVPIGIKTRSLRKYKRGEEYTTENVDILLFGGLISNCLKYRSRKVLVVLKRPLRIRIIIQNYVQPNYWKSVRIANVIKIERKNTAYTFVATYNNRSLTYITSSNDWTE